MLVLEINGIPHSGKTTALVAIAKNLDNCLFISREEEAIIFKKEGIINVIERPLFQTLDLEGLLSMININFDNVVIDGIYLPRENEDMKFIHESDIKFYISKNLYRKGI